ncbi:MAG: DUF262 domain-containing protein [Hyphomonadaceae bacterium]|nr:DUF262 domain-containing protein [Hyphomonadaceae bacterium]
MKGVQTLYQVTLNNLLTRLKDGRFVVPDFQREFEWKPRDILELMRSIFLDYHIGSLLLWKGQKKNFDALACEPIYGYTGGGSSREHIVLDGQQRLTALYYACVAPDVPPPNRKNRVIYFIRVDHFMREEYDDAFDYEWGIKRIEKLTSDSSIQYREHIFPLSVIGAADPFLMSNWLQEYTKHWNDKTEETKQHGDGEEVEQYRIHAQNAEKFGKEIMNLTQQYHVSYIELDEELGLDRICDIFTRINSKGVPLEVFDLLNAMLKPHDLQLKFMWREARKSECLGFVKSDKLNVYVLQIMSILEQAYCSPKYLYYLIPGQEKVIRTPDGKTRKEVLVGTKQEFTALWDRSVSALENAIRMLRQPQRFGVTSSKYLPYVSILPVFSALQEHVRTLPANKQLDAQRKVRFWYWAAIFTSRYSGAVESTAARDFRDIKTWIDDDAKEPPLIEEFREKLKSLDLRKETKRGRAVYNAIFNLLVINGAPDWFTGNIIDGGELDDHHIVPASWGKNNLQDDPLIHSIPNRTPLLGSTNRDVIRNRLPNEYLPDLIADNGEDRIRKMLENHLISPAAFDILMRPNFTATDFNEFIDERHKTLVKAIGNLLIEERLDLSPDLRELDESIEKVELALRSKIETTVSGQEPVNALLSSIMKKIQCRLGQEQNRDPAFNRERYTTIGGMLEFIDLQDLKDIIVAKLNWQNFSDTFGRKGQVENQFNQLAAMRNSIRHGRTVSEICRKDGEAALLWFEGILARKGQP